MRKLLGTLVALVLAIGAALPSPPAMAYGGTVLLALETETKSGNKTSGTVEVRILGDPENFPTDDLYKFNGKVVTVQSFSVGTLDSGVPPGSVGILAAGPPSTNVSGLTRIDTDCIEINTSHTYGYHCFKRYKPSSGDADPQYDYRVGWFTGSSNAKPGNDITKIRDRFALTDCEAGSCNDFISEWRPSGTYYPPESGQDVTIKLGVTEPGFTAEVSSTMRIYSERYGPDGYGPTHSYFAWWGEKDKSSVVPMAGGEEWAFKKGYTHDISLKHWYCWPDWAC